MQGQALFIGFSEVLSDEFRATGQTPLDRNRRRLRQWPSEKVNISLKRNTLKSLENGRNSCLL